MFELWGAIHLVVRKIGRGFTGVMRRRTFRGLRATSIREVRTPVLLPGMVVAMGVVFTFGPGAPAVEGQEGTMRLLAFDDLLRLEGLGLELGGAPVAFSPEGDQVAYVRLRPTMDAVRHDQRYLRGNHRGDIWVADVTGGDPRRITPGDADGFGYWAPIWAPDGRRIALLSNRGDDVGLHLWDRATGELTRPTPSGIETPTGVGAPFAVVSTPTWISDTEIVFAVVPEGRRSANAHRQRWTPEAASVGWERARQGTQVTANVLESGVPIDPAEAPQGRLLLHDARTGETVTLLERSVLDFIPSPEGDWIAVYLDREGPELPRAGAPLPLPHPFDPLGYELRLISRGGDAGARTLEGVIASPRGYLEWAPDGSRFAFEGRISGGDGSERGEDEILIYTPATDELVRVDFGELLPITPARLRWSGEGGLIVLARSSGGDRPDWWRMDESGGALNLTSNLPAVPGQLYRVAGEAKWAGVSQGDLWVVSERGEEPRRVTDTLDDPVTQIAGIDRPAARNGGVAEILLRTRGGDGSDALWSVELVSGGTLTSIPIPEEGAGLVGYSPSTRIGAFHTSDRTGTRLQLTGVRLSEPRLLFEGNRFLQEIAKGEVRSFEYASAEGDTLVAWLLLPPEGANHRQVDGLYPLITRVYPNMRLGAGGPPWGAANIHEPGTLSPQLFAAQGYAVLFPSTPIRPGEVISDLVAGVLPAVDRAIELGVADPDRLAIMGESDGGYSTYALVTQTDRFQAAIALWGAVNLVSYYGQFEAEVRYGDAPHRRSNRIHDVEMFGFGMGAPPWERMDLYMHNSPIAHIHQVETPVLMVHGDLDFIGIQQAEEFFTGLYRLGKRARFVRYWGEAHGPALPANQQDLVNHIFEWLDKFLVVPPG